MKNVFGFLASTNGRIIRAIAGVTLISFGLVVLGGSAGAILALIGIVPFAAGLFDFCLFAPLFGYPFWGKELRGRTAPASHV